MRGIAPGPSTNRLGLVSPEALNVLSMDGWHLAAPRAATVPSVPPCGFRLRSTVPAATMRAPEGRLAQLVRALP